jgi:hypothetical protein
VEIFSATTGRRSAAAVPHEPTRQAGSDHCVEEAGGPVDGHEGGPGSGDRAVHRPADDLGQLDQTSALGHTGHHVGVDLVAQALDLGPVDPVTSPLEVGDPAGHGLVQGVPGLGQVR